MGRRTYTPEQIINKLREVEILLGQGAAVTEASKKIGVAEQTYYDQGQVNHGGPILISNLLQLSWLVRGGLRARQYLLPLGGLHPEHEWVAA